MGTMQIWLLEAKDLSDERLWKNHRRDVRRIVVRAENEQDARVEAAFTVGLGTGAKEPGRSDFDTPQLNPWNKREATSCDPLCEELEPESETVEKPKVLAVEPVGYRDRPLRVEGA